MKKSWYVKMLFLLLGLVITLLLLFKAYCRSNDYWCSVGVYHDMNQRSAIWVDNGPYSKYGIRECFIFMHTEDDEFFEKIESRDVVFVVHTGILIQNECSTTPIHCIKLNKGIYDFYNKHLVNVF